MTEQELLVLNYRNEFLKSHRDAATSKIAKIQANVDIYLKLRDAGIWPKGLSDLWVGHAIKEGFPVKIEADQLPGLRKLFDQVKDTGDYDVEDAAKALVKVRLDIGVPNATIRLYYVKELPPDAKCQIHTQTFASHSVVCQI